MPGIVSIQMNSNRAYAVPRNRKAPVPLPWLFSAGLTVVMMCMLLYTGGCRNSGPRHITAEELTGKWKSEGTSYKDTRTYTGSYDLHSTGSHTYDIVVSDGVHKQGTGTWKFTPETNTLQVENDTGSVYVGSFQDGNFQMISLMTTNKQWGVVLGREKGGPRVP